MRLDGSAGQLLLVAGLVLAHFAFRPLLTGWTGAPDLLVGGLLLGALFLRAGYAALLGAVLGLLEGAMALRGMGALMIVYTVVGYGAARSSELLFSDIRSFLPVYLFLGAWTAQLGSGLLTPGAMDMRFGFVEAPLTAATTTVVCWLGQRVLTPAVG